MVLLPHLLFYPRTAFHIVHRRACVCVCVWCRYRLYGLCSDHAAEVDTPGVLDVGADAGLSELKGTYTWYGLSRRQHRVE